MGRIKNFGYKLQDSFDMAVYRGRRLLLDTPVEILIGAVALGSAAGIMSYNTNKAREAEIPIAFSEIESISATYAKNGQTVPTLTRFYAANNDIAMKIFESSNIALRQGDDPALFARELRTRIEPGLSDYTPLTAYTNSMRADAGAALATLDPIHGASVRMRSVAAAFGNAWSASHYDHYHTEIYYTYDCSGTGSSRTCSNTMHTRQVYDYTTHTYTYNRAEGQRALRLLNDYAASSPDITIPERLITAREVHAANMAVIARSMKDALDGKMPTPAQALEYANTWARGSNFAKYLPTIYATQRQLLQSANAWTSIEGQARSVQYDTYSSSDSGPAAYQVAVAAQTQAQRLSGSADEITNGIKFSAAAVPQLDRQIRAFIDVALYGHSGDAYKMRKDILKLARDIYNQNEENGFDVEPFSWPQIILLTFLGTLAGAALGLGADKLLQMPTMREILARGPKRRERPSEEKEGELTAEEKMREMEEQLRRDLQPKGSDKPQEPRAPQPKADEQANEPPHRRFKRKKMDL